MSEEWVCARSELGVDLLVLLSPLDVLAPVVLFISRLDVAEGLYQMLVSTGPAQHFFLPPQQVQRPRARRVVDIESGGLREPEPGLLGEYASSSRIFYGSPPATLFARQWGAEGYSNDRLEPARIAAECVRVASASSSAALLLRAQERRNNWCEANPLVAAACSTELHIYIVIISGPSPRLVAPSAAPLSDSARPHSLQTCNYTPSPPASSRAPLPSPTTSSCYSLLDLASAPHHAQPPLPPAFLASATSTETSSSTPPPRATQHTAVPENY